MGRKHLGMKRPLKQFERSLDEMYEYISAFQFLPPRGCGARKMAIKEWKQVCNDVLIQFNNVRNAQIDLLERDEDDEV